MAEYAVVTQVSPLMIRPRGTTTPQPAKKLSQVTGLAFGVDVAYDLIDTTETDEGKKSGTLLVLGTVN